MGNYFGPDLRTKNRQLRLKLAFQNANLDHHIDSVKEKKNNAWEEFVDAVKRRDNVSKLAIGKQIRLLTIQLSNLNNRKLQNQALEIQLEDLVYVNDSKDLLERINKLLQSTDKKIDTKKTIKVSQAYQQLTSQIESKGSIIDDVFEEVMESKIDQGEEREEIARDVDKSDFIQQLEATALDELMPSTSTSTSSVSARPRTTFSLLSK